MSPKKISLDHIDPRKHKVRELIVSIHNYYRAKVHPPASNMLEVVSCVYSTVYLHLQRGTKRYVHLAKQDPGKARQSS